MKPIKKFSMISTGAAKGADSILESANLSPEALEELVKKLGYNNIDEVKKEKALLSKLEALLKEFAPKEDVSEDDAKDIEDEVVKMGEPKSLEDEEGEKEEDGEVGAEGEIAEEDEMESDDEDTSDEVEDEVVKMGEPKDEPESKGDEVVTDDQPITDEVPEEGDDEDSGEEIEKEEEAEERPAAKKRIMTFEDFVQEKEVTVNKNVNYRDDEEEEDYAVPVAEEDKEEEIEHDKDAAEDDYAHAEDLKKDAADDKEEEEELENESVNTTSTIKSFSSFVSEGYGMEEDDYEEDEEAEEEEVTEEADNGPELSEETPDDNGIAVKIAKGDGSETAAGIAGDTMEMGKPKEESEKDGEELVTKDQPITKAPETSKDEPNVQGKVVVKESTVTEKEIKSDKEFEEYATEILKQAHGDDFDEAKAKEVIDGLKSKYSGDYGAMVGALQSSMG